MPERFIGLMSGTSLDGVDAVVVEFDGTAIRQRASHYLPFPPEHRKEFEALQKSGEDELHRSALAANNLARLYAGAASSVMHEAALSKLEILALGCHGQTLRHQPAHGYTIQILNGALLAELTGIKVICDFRSRDLAAGGQGAPLVPAFHQAAFADAHMHRVVVNVGGIANLTDLPPFQEVSGFDCGPGNVLMDGWAQQHLGQAVDLEGRWGQGGEVLEDLLQRLLAHEFFMQVPPKSTGRDDFNLDWLHNQLRGTERPVDVQATLQQFTAETIALAIRDHCRGAQEIFLCGGGVHNQAMVERLRHIMASRVSKIRTTDELGIGVDWVEAVAFAWLAKQCLHGHTGNLPKVTGACGTRILGAIYSP